MTGDRRRGMNRATPATKIYSAEEAAARRAAQRPTKCERCGTTVRLQLDSPVVTPGTPDWWHHEPDITHDDFEAGTAGDDDIMYVFELVDGEIVEGCWRRHTSGHCTFFRRIDDDEDEA